MIYKIDILDDILDIGEELISECKEDNLFVSCNYYLKKYSKSIFSPKPKTLFLGKYTSLKDSYKYGFEDITFLAKNINDFSPLVEALEIENAKTLYFYFVNFGKVQDKLKKNEIMDINLSIEIKKLVKLPILSKIDFLLEDNKELIDLASQGNYRAIEKLEELLKEEAYKVLRFYKTKPYKLFQTYFKYINKAYYEFVGIVKNITLKEDIIILDLEIDKYQLKAFQLSKTDEIEIGERVLIFGNLMGSV